jgi:tRNA(Ile)-lysidine synthase
MSVKRGRFIRPLISVPREEVLQYLSQYGISYCQDRSNFEIRFRRNFVRAEILPRFLALNPGFLTIADRTSRLFKAEDELLDSLADEALNRMVVERSPDGFCLDIKQFLGCNDVIKWRIIRRLRPGLSFDEIGRVLAIAQGRVGARVELLRGWIARRESDGLYLGAPPKPFPDEVEVAVPGSTRVEELRLILETEVVWGGIRPEGLKCEAFDLDAIEPPIKLRARRAGDRLVLGDKSYQKRLKSIFIDDKVPRRIRDRIPLLCDRAGVLWVVGGRRSARARIGPKTRRTLVVRFERWNGSLNQVVA